MNLFKKEEHKTRGKQQKRPAILDPRVLLQLLVILLCAVALITLCAFGGYHLTKNALASGRMPVGDMTEAPEGSTPAATTEPITEATTEATTAATTEAVTQPLDAAEQFLETAGDTFFADLQNEVDFLRLNKWADGGFDSPQDLKPRSIFNAYVAEGELRAQLEEGERVRLSVDDLNAFAQKYFGVEIAGKDIVKAINNDKALYMENNTLVFNKKAISWPDDDWVLEKNAYAAAGDLLVVNLTRRYDSGTRTSLTITLTVGAEGYQYVSVVDESDLLADAGSYDSGTSGETGQSKVNELRAEYYAYFKAHPTQVQALFSYPENANGLAVFALLNCGQDISQGVSPQVLEPVLDKYFDSRLADWNTDYSYMENGLVYAKDLNFSGTNRLVLDKYSETSTTTTATFAVYHFDGEIPAETDTALAAGKTDGFRKAGTLVMKLSAVPDSTEAGGSYYVIKGMEPSGMSVVKKPEVKEPTVTLDTGSLTVGSLALGMDYESAGALLGDPDLAPVLTEGKLVFTKGGVEYTFCQIDDSYSAAYDSLRDGRFYLLKMATAGSTGDFVLDLKVGDSLQDALAALGCPDAKLQQWAEQTLYNRKSGSAYMYYTIKTASYRIEVHVGDTHLTMQFDGDDLLTSMVLELAP